MSSTKVESNTALTNPTLKAGWIAVHQGMIRDITSDHCPGANEGILTDSVTTDNGSVGANAGPFPDQGLFEFILSRDMAAGVDDIGEDARGAAEDTVFEGHPLKHRDIVLDLDIVAYLDTPADEDILADNTVPADGDIWHDMAEVPDFDTVADLKGSLNDAGFVNEVTLLTRQRNSLPILLQRPLASVQYLQHAQPTAAIGPGTLAGLYAI